MEPPKCKLCGQKHYGTCAELLRADSPILSKGRYRELRKTSPAMRRLETQTANVIDRNDKHCATCRCFPMTAAQRQKAYRQRHKVK